MGCSNILSLSATTAKHLANAEHLSDTERNIPVTIVVLNKKSTNKEAIQHFEVGKFFSLAYKIFYVYISSACLKLQIVKLQIANCIDFICRSLAHKYAMQHMECVQNVCNLITVLFKDFEVSVSIGRAPNIVNFLSLGVKATISKFLTREIMDYNFCEGGIER